MSLNGSIPSTLQDFFTHGILDYFLERNFSTEPAYISNILCFPILPSIFVLKKLGVITFFPHELPKNAQCPHELPTQPK
jgi:hypothetical protein